MVDEASPERQGSLPDGEGFGGLLAECVETARAAVASLHPRRLAVGLLAVLLLGQIGDLHDRLAGPRFGPGGLLAEDPEAELVASIERWRSRLSESIASEADSGSFDAESATPWQLLAEGRRRLVASRSSRIDDDADLGGEARVEMERVFLEDRPLGTYDAVSSLVAGRFGDFCRSVVAIDPRSAATSLGGMVIDVPVAVWRHDRLFLLSFGLPALIVSTLLGGMVARMAACRFARRQWLTLGESADFVGASWRRLISAPLLPLAAALVPLGAVALLGLVLSVPWLDVVAGVLFGSSLILGLLAGILLVGIAVGWPLIVPAVACEDADATDCLQRAYAYPFNRFGRYLVLAVAAIVGLAVAVAVLDALLLTTLWSVRLAVAGTAPAWVGELLDGRGWLEFGAPSPAMLSIDGVAADAVATWVSLSRLLVGALVFAWLFDAGVRIHLFLRRAVDRVRPEEIAESPGQRPRAERVREAIEAARRAS
jgi:hypothetical protein